MKEIQTKESRKCSRCKKIIKKENEICKNCNTNMQDSLFNKNPILYILLIFIVIIFIFYFPSFRFNNPSYNEYSNNRKDFAEVFCKNWDGAHGTSCYIDDDSLTGEVHDVVKLLNGNTLVSLVGVTNEEDYYNANPNYKYDFYPSFCAARKAYSVSYVCSSVDELNKL